MRPAQQSSIYYRMNESVERKRRERRETKAAKHESRWAKNEVERDSMVMICI